MTMKTVRKLSVTPVLKGFWGGVAAGLASSDFAFYVPKNSYRSGQSVQSGFALDREALRKDVEKAKSEFARSIAASAYAS